jgi:hypothetical protein
MSAIKPCWRRKALLRSTFELGRLQIAQSHLRVILMTLLPMWREMIVEMLRMSWKGGCLGWLINLNLLDD